MTNINDLNNILTTRMASLNQRLERLPHYHPLIRLKKLENLIPVKIKNESMLFKCFTSTILKEYIEEKKSTKSKQTLKTFISSKITENSSKKSSLVCYTMIPKKNKRSKSDITYRIQNRQIRANALKWRRNIIGFFDHRQNSRNNNNYNRVKECFCSHCNVPFTRRHVNTCPLVTQHNSIPLKHWILFHKNNEKLKKDYPHADSYTIIDHLINTFQIRSFNEVFIEIIAHLRYEFHPNNQTISSSPSSTTNNTENEEHFNEHELNSSDTSEPRSIDSIPPRIFQPNSMNQNLNISRMRYRSRQ
jgi:hypothetical protein